MAGSIVGASQVGTGNPTMPVAKPTGTTTGDVILAFQSGDSSTLAAMTAPTTGGAWTLINSLDRGSGDLHVILWAKTAGGSEPTSYTFNQGSGSDGTVIVVTARDVTMPSSGDGVLSFTAAGAGTSYTAPSLSGVGAGAVLLCGGMTEKSGGGGALSWTPPTGMTEQGDVQSQTFTSGTVAFLLNPSGTTGTQSFTVSSSVSGGPGVITWSIALAATSQNLSGSAAATMKLAAAAVGAKNASGAATATARLAAVAAGAKGAAGTSTATLTLSASATGFKTVAVTAVLRLIASATGVKGELVTAPLRLAASTSGNTRATPGITVSAALRLSAGAALTSTRQNTAPVAVLHLFAFADGHRVITAIARQVLVQPAPTTSYELVCVARVQQPSGPPVFLQVDPIDWTGLSYTEELSKAPQLNIGCQITGLTEPILQRLRKPAELPTELWLYRNGRLVFSGPLGTGQVQGEALTLTATGALGYLRMMVVDADTVFSGVDQFKIVTSLIDAWQGDPYGNFGLDTSNIAPSGVLRDATYLAKELHNVGQRVEELGLRENGFDIWVDPASRKLQLAYPQRGVDRSTGEDSIVFDERNITSPNILVSVAPGDVASEAFGTGTGNQTIYSARSNTDLRAQYGRTAVTASFDGVSEQATLDDHVQGLLDARSTALLVPGPDVRVTPDSDVGAYDVGDTVSYSMHSLLSAAGAFRLRKRTVTVSKTGQEAVSVAFV